MAWTWSAIAPGLRPVGRISTNGSGKARRAYATPTALSATGPPSGVARHGPKLLQGMVHGWASRPGQLGYDTTGLAQGARATSVTENRGASATELWTWCRLSEQLRLLTVAYRTPREMLWVLSRLRLRETRGGATVIKQLRSRTGQRRTRMGTGFVGASSRAVVCTCATYEASGLRVNHGGNTTHASNGAWALTGGVQWHRRPGGS